MVKRRSTDIIAAEHAASDANAFRAAVRDVRPLLQTPQPSGLAKPKSRALARNATPPAMHDLDETMPLVGGLPADEGTALAGAVTGDGPLSFQRSGVRIQVMRRLRRGLFPIEDELDLHGLNQSAARDRLADFIARNRDAGCRCVRIIHGKGYRSGARGPVLKAAVNLWLRRHTDVMAFVSARPIDGGAGAMYVLLRT
ncbi:MAG: Smr/MutS family protein [Gammaproteobacteria bacterium]